MFKRSNDPTLSRKRPKKRERLQPDTEEEDEDEDEDAIGERLANSSSNARTYDTYNKSNSISHLNEKDRAYKIKKENNSASASPTIKVHSLSKQTNEKTNKQQYNSNGETASNHIKKAARVGSTSSSTLNDELADTNSSSSDDQPLSQSSANSKKACKTYLTTKRKVEVLSKESGKIGVTIKTSPEAPSSNKILFTNVSATPITVPIKTEPAPLSPETPASHPESNTPPEKPSTSTLTGKYQLRM